MKVVLALACLLALGSAKPTSTADDFEWENYKRHYGKNYGDDDSELDRVRRAIYFETKEAVEAHNEQYKKGITTFEQGINKFADQLPEEVLGTYNRSKADDVEWKNYKQHYGKNYGGADSELERIRRILYFDAKKFVQAHNELYKKGLKSYTLALNQFADHHTKEVAAMLNGFKIDSDRLAELYVPVYSSLPKSVNWRTKKVVTPVKNQGQCRSCWAFSATGSLEGQWALKKGKLVSLSEQQLVDCTSFGCKGGYTGSAFLYIKNKGIDSEASYPYTAKVGVCAFNKTKVAATVTGYRFIRPGSETDLAIAVAKVGPISVAIDASKRSFQMYKAGVYDEPTCSTTHLNHAVLAAGYGSEGGSDYWLVKNSWGFAWGLKGYIKMSRNKNNQCGIATRALFPTV